jgi:two-component system KDP operon response regulator KdpE
MTRPDTILIADDDASLRQVITTLLQEEGFNVLQAADGNECLHVAYEQRPDLVLLDIMMPNKDGREVCQRLREFSSIPIIMLTAISQEREIVDRLLGGADDYITKPFDNDELVARIRAVLRRTRQHGRQPPYDDGYLYIDFDARQVRVKGNGVSLTPKEWRLLEYLIKNANRVVPRQTLLRHVWGAGYEDQSNYLKVFIAHLRHKLNDPARHPRYILTEHNIGYRFQTHH